MVIGQCLSAGGVDLLGDAVVALGREIGHGKDGGREQGR